jgi:hypothetical protein
MSIYADNVITWSTKATTTTPKISDYVFVLTAALLSLSLPPVMNHWSGVIESAKNNGGNQKQQPPVFFSQWPRYMSPTHIWSLFTRGNSMVKCYLKTPWESGDTHGANNEANFLPVPGLSWNSNVLTIRWFPWIPIMKPQIQSFKVVELKAACDQW